MADSVLNKNAKGYGYKYTDLAEVNKYVEELGERYYQYTETTENGNDYIHTVRLKGDKEIADVRGCKIMSVPLANKANVAQEYGSGLTYARRYSLYMAYGLATEDDDAETYTREQKTSSKNTTKKEEDKKEEDKKEEDKPTKEQLTELQGKLAKTDDEFKDGIKSMYNLEKGLTHIASMSDYNDIVILVDNELKKIAENENK